MSEFICTYFYPWILRIIIMLGINKLTITKLKKVSYFEINYQHNKLLFYLINVLTSSYVKLELKLN